MSVSSQQYKRQQYKRVNWLTTHAISKPQTIKFHSKTNQVLINSGPPFGSVKHRSGHKKIVINKWLNEWKIIDQ